MAEKQPDQQTLSRGLKDRHVQLIALGGAIGTGLFLGSGKSIHVAGPSILLAYLITGIMCFLLMRALGELLLADLHYNSFVDAIRDYLGSRAAFITGWTYWLCWVAIAMAEITAIGMYVQLWLPNCPQWVPGLITLAVLLCVNLITVGAFGEVESWFALIKIFAILLLIAIGIGMMLVRFKSPNGIVTSPSNLISHGGFFATGLDGFLKSFQMVIFSFAGIEMVGMTAAETANPRKVIPKAINDIPVRILLFYIGALFVIMSIYPWNRLDPNSSPFVMVFKDIGISSAASIINFVVLTAAASSCNSALYTTGRMLAELTSTSRRPSIRKISHISKNSVPATAIVISALLMGMSSLLNYLIPSEVFTLVSSVATTSFLFIWGTIVLAHLRYRKVHPEGSGFKMPGTPVTDWMVLIFLFAVGVILMFSADTRIALIIAVVWLAFMTVLSMTFKEYKYN
ncbi:MAG: amino acid permease [Limosilactobacillus mucosae]|nr:amino acid permease [Limosilactobacillus mucosae]